MATALLMWFGVVGTAAANAATELASDQGIVRIAPARSESDMQYSMALESGKSASIETSFTVKRVSVGNPEVLEVVVLDGRTIQLVSKSEGSTNLLLWDSNGRPQAVVSIDVGAPRSQMQRALRSAFGNDSIEVSSAGKAIVLKGSVPSTVELDQVLSLARALVGDDEHAPEVVNLLSVGGNHQVMLKVVVAEMSRTLTREFGTNFAALLSTGSGHVFGGGFNGAAPTIAALGSNVGKLFGSFSSLGALELLEVFMDVLHERGLSKILAKPTLVARSGETASFLVGGEVPIPVAQGGAFGSITIEFKDFGVGLDFTPTVLAPDRIHLTVNPEVSRVDSTFGTDFSGFFIPGFATRRAATSVELADGQSFMIAGLLSDQVRELAGKYPILGDLPILGALFRSTEFQKEETELVIIVTPVLVKPMGPGPHQLPTDHFIEPNDLEFYLFGALEGNPNRFGGNLAADFEPSGMIGKTGHTLTTSFDGDSQ